MLPKRRFWTTEQRTTRRVCFFKYFSRVSRCPNEVLTHVKSALKTLSDMFVQLSKIFVWGFVCLFCDTAVCVCVS